MSNAGVDVAGKVGVATQLSGNSSSDGNGDPLTFSWILISKPGDSMASLSDVTSRTPTLTPDVSGTYVAALVVNDGTVNSAPSSVTVTVSPDLAVAFDSFPTVLPPNVPSVGVHANSYRSLGDEVVPQTGGLNFLDKVDVVLSSWACEFGVYSSTAPADKCITTAGKTYEHPVTLIISDANGQEIFRKTQPFEIPFRPTADETCSNPQSWRAADNTCTNGYAFEITFDVRVARVTLPQAVRYTVAFETSRLNNGALVPGPYDLLNIGLTQATPSVGADADGGNGTLFVDGVSEEWGYGLLGRIHVNN